MDEGELKRYIKEGSGGRQLSPLGAQWETWRGGSFTRRFEIQ